MPGFVCMATQLETESLSPGILEIGCQNYTRTNLYCFISLNCFFVMGILKTQRSSSTENNFVLCEFLKFLKVRGWNERAQQEFFFNEPIKSDFKV